MKKISRLIAFVLVLTLSISYDIYAQSTSGLVFSTGTHKVNFDISRVKIHRLGYREDNTFFIENSFKSVKETIEFDDLFNNLQNYADRFYALENKAEQKYETINETSISIPSGLYLVDTSNSFGDAFTSSPSLVEVKENGIKTIELKISEKTKEKQPDDRLINTGQDWKTPFVFLVISIFSIVLFFLKKNKLILGIIFFSIITSAYLIKNNYDEDRYSKLQSEKALNLFSEEISEKRLTLEENTSSILILDKEFMGIVEVPSVDIRLPIASKTNTEQLKSTPIYYSGSLANNNLVLCGHNYQHQFGKLNDVYIGEKVYLTIPNGKSIAYTITNVESMNDTEVTRMIRKTDWDLTLYTCSIDGSKRVAIRANRS